MNFIRKILKDAFCDKKSGQYTFSIGRFMVLTLFGLAFYQWSFTETDIMPNMFAIFSSTLMYVLGTKGINEWGKTKEPDMVITDGPPDNLL